MEIDLDKLTIVQSALYNPDDHDDRVRKLIEERDGIILKTWMDQYGGQMITLCIGKHL